MRVGMYAVLQLRDPVSPRRGVPPGNRTEYDATCAGAAARITRPYVLRQSIRICKT